MSDERYSLATGLMQLRGNYKTLENHLLRNFRKYASRNLVEYDSDWHWLALAQHHGLPTRLLDWTFSPFVALHFATVNIDKFDRNGIIWAVNYNDYHKILPKLLRNNLKEEGAALFTVKILAKTQKSLRDLELIDKSPFILFFEPPSIDERIVNQSALFSILSYPDLTCDKYLENNPISEYSSFKVIIPSDLKWEIRDKLDQSNITERVLFPGLDGLSEWLSHYYSPKSR